MQRLSGKHILVGISGGIAAYKAPILVRQLLAQGATVQIVMTDNAHQFVTATSLQAVSGHPVRTSLWDHAAEAAMGHIELARWADLVLIAPTTASLMARLATGQADDLLTTLCLATSAPLHLAPAMNQGMWQHPATQDNLAVLIRRGAIIHGPAEGDQACGDIGPGRLMEPEDLVDSLIAHARTGDPSTDSGSVSASHGADRTLSSTLSTTLSSEGRPGILAGTRVLVTAGPTREALDPVRYISNHSSGKQGYAVAIAAHQQGAEVTLISGPVALAAPDGIKVISVTSAQEMYEAVMEAAPKQEIVIGVAAVADYRPVQTASQKLKKINADKSGSSTIQLSENPDIIASVTRLPQPPFTVGFAAETEQALANARAKRLRKGLDMIVVNDVSQTDIGFDNDQNAVTIISAQGERRLARTDKSKIAQELILEIASVRRQMLATPNPAKLAD